jgi:hypothetical protein
VPLPVVSLVFPPVMVFLSSAFVLRMRNIHTFTPDARATRNCPRPL